MPLVRIAMQAGKSAAYRRAVADAVHAAIVEAGNVPALDRFQIISEHPADGFVYDTQYLGIERSDDLVMIQITLNQRTQPVKLAIYRAICDRLTRNPGLRAQDVLISLVPVTPEDWSFGEGRARYVKETPA